jgi:hypothetical protein
LGARLANIPEQERPGKVIFAILTDGKENDSQEYEETTIREMIRHQEDAYQWQVLFLSSDIRAEADALKYGIRSGATLNYATGGKGMRAAFAGLTEVVTSYRTTSSTTAEFNPQLKEEQKKERSS